MRTRLLTSVVIHILLSLLLISSPTPIQGSTRSLPEQETVNTNSRRVPLSAANAHQIDNVANVRPRGYEVHFLSDSQRLAVFYQDEVRIINLADSEEVVLEESFFPSLRGSAFSPDGSRMVSIGDISQSGQIVVVWDIDSGEVMHFFNTEPNFSAVLSPDARYVAVRYPDRNEIRATATGEITATLPMQGTLDQFTQFTQFAQVGFSPDGNLLAVMEPDDVIRLWNTGTGELEKTYPFPGGGTVAFSPDGRWMVATNRDEIRVWDTATDEAFSLPAGYQDLTSDYFSSDGSLLLYSVDDNGYTFWDFQTSQSITVAGEDSWLMGPNGLFAHANFATDSIDLIDIRSQRRLISLDYPEGMYGGWGFSPDGTLLAIGGEAAINLWAAPGASFETQFAGVEVEFGSDAFAFSLPDRVPSGWLSQAMALPRYRITFTSQQANLEVCTYTAGVVIRIRIDVTVTIRDLETNSTVASRTFSSQSPDACPQRYLFRSPSAELLGDPPNYDAFTEWLNQVMTPLGFTP